MILPDLPAFPSRHIPGGRVYRVTERVELVAFVLDAPMPGAEAGFIVYAFVQGRKVGRWDWTADPDSIERVANAFRTTTSHDYDPPTPLAPGGEPAQLRPPIQDLLARAMEAARPGPREPERTGNLGSLIVTDADLRLDESNASRLPLHLT